MSSDPPVVFDEDNPEWTEEDFARARPLSEIPELAHLLPVLVRGASAPRQCAISIRLDADIVEHFRATGPGWQTRINEALRKAIG